MRKQNRPLTNDERKAAEAAFQGAPFDDHLSESARKVYMGISLAMADGQRENLSSFDASLPTSRLKRTSKERSIRSSISLLW